MPYCFSRSFVKFRGHAGQKIANFDPNWAFTNCNSSLTSPMALKWCTKLDVVKKRSPIVFQGQISRSHRMKYCQFRPKLSFFLDCNSGLNSPMDLKWCTMLDIVQKKYPIVFLGHPSNFTVTQAEKSSIWIQFEITRPQICLVWLNFNILFSYTVHSISLSFLQRTHYEWDMECLLWVYCLNKVIAFFLSYCRVLCYIWL